MNQTSENWPWSVLELEGPPKDIKDVKRAYAKRVKIVRPNEDAEGFRDLRAAYEAAQNQIRWQSYDEIDEGGDNENEVNVAPDVPETTEEGTSETTTAQETVTPTLFEEFSATEESKPEPENPWQLVWDTTEKTANLLCIEETEYDDEGEPLPPKPNPWGNRGPVYDVDTWSELIDKPELQRLDLWDQLSNSLRWQVLQHLGWDHNAKDPTPAALQPKFAQFLVDRFDWFYEENVHNPVVGRQSAFLRAALRFGGLTVPERRPGSIDNSIYEFREPKKPPFYLRWWFFLILGGLLHLVRDLYYG